MLLVLLADDAFFFMIAWELMSVASYFLVVVFSMKTGNRRAAFIYLLMAEVGALAIILGFGVLASFADGFTFAMSYYRKPQNYPRPGQASPLCWR